MSGSAHFMEVGDERSSSGICPHEVVSSPCSQGASGGGAVEMVGRHLQRQAPPGLCLQSQGPERKQRGQHPSSQDGTGHGFHAGGVS